MIFFNNERRQQRLQIERDKYQQQIQTENIRNLQLQNAALSASIQAMRGTVGGTGSVPGQTMPIRLASGGTAPLIGRNASNAAAQTNSNNSSNNFPSLAEIQSMIESSQQKAEEDFMSKIDLLKSQEQQKQEEDQLSARNAANRVQSYQRQSAIGAWESALRGR